ncbi:MAG TPA: uroporphyrinogen-III C-methyltransferase [Gemmatimonadales bacterium]|nr:uroporphyrinogen-III C-methyltransferase [Gemmatimonadales bacterium]
MKALVLAAHGSNRDPSANALVRRLAETVRARRLFDEVAVAFHQGEPGFGGVLDELRADEVTVVPVMTSAGHYSDIVLPAALAENRRFAELRLRQTPPVGAHPGLPALVARRVSELLRAHDLGRASTSLLLVGHGTRRHTASRDTTLALADILRRRRVAGEVLAGFIDDDPPLGEAFAGAALEAVLVLPFLMGGGAHVLADIPDALGIAPGDGSGTARIGGRLVVLDAAVGALPGIADLIVDLARRHPPPPPAFRPRGKGAPPRPVGTVHLVGAGPGDPGLITARGLELLRTADVVVYDRLVGPDLLREARPDAELVDVGKGPGHAALSQEEIHLLLVERARRGRSVLRLKGGDPFVFGRGSEELAACREAGVPAEVVPGVSSAIAAPAAAGIPVTARGIARSFAVVTAHQAGPPGEGPDLAALAGVDTIVILMGRASLADLASRLITAGRDPATPAACIQSATTPAQRVTRATLATIAAAADRDGLEAPVVTVIGAVAAMAGEGAGWPADGAGLRAAIGA